MYAKLIKMQNKMRKSNLYLHIVIYFLLLAQDAAVATQQQHKKNKNNDKKIQQRSKTNNNQHSIGVLFINTFIIKQKEFRQL